MKPLSKDRPRQVIPRWRDFETTARLGEVSPVTVHRETSRRSVTDDASREQKEWASHHTVPFATDFIAAAIATGHVEVANDAIDFLTDPTTTVPPLARRVALNLRRPTDIDATEERAVRPLSVEVVRAIIRDQKARLQFRGRDALAWAELARGYILLGFQQQSTKAMERALSLAPEDRFVLRSAARLFLHVGDTNRALRVLQATTRHRDPWLFAAEIAVADRMGRPSRFAKAGLQLISSRDLLPFHITELASALGTLEASAGGIRKAKKLFRIAMLQPTENSVAQAEWAERNGNLITLRPDDLNVPLSFEARTGHLLAKSQWRDAYNQCVDWLNDQPFAKRPALDASYIASVILQDYESAIDVIEYARVANESDWMLLNNLAFSYASADQLQQAQKVFEKLSPETGDPFRHGTWLATSGLLAFRANQYDDGRALYVAAVEEFVQNNLRDSEALARMFLAREELNAGTAFAEVALNGAREAVNRSGSPEIVNALANVERLSAPSPEEATSN